MTTENFIGTIKAAPPPIEIPWTRATCYHTGNHHKVPTSIIIRQNHNMTIYALEGTKAPGWK